ncbi:hypothetical protein [Bradyrhizobium sp. Cp5.3]|uniref:hypothetical protein n=1 Tax=Bradyrhizobium sp. Cp5.3 TaxID=443598 RepID=UPI000A0733DE|nr:hypothetical protein [Bradyrhizobium sp. Cp5.3]
MSFETERDEANGPTLERSNVAGLRARQSSSITRKISVQLSEQIFERLEAATERPGVGKSSVVEAALERFLDPAPPIEGLIYETLDRINSRLEHLDGEVRIIAETVALHARYHLTVTPAMPQPQQRQACALGRDRFEALAEQINRRVSLRRPLMRETIDRIENERVCAGTTEIASPASAEPAGDSAPVNNTEETADMIAAAEEGGSNRNFQHLPNAFC